MAPICHLSFVIWNGHGESIAANSYLNLRRQNHVDRFVKRCRVQRGGDR